MDERHEILTVGEAATILRVSEKTIVRELRKGSLKGSKVGGAWRIRRNWVDEYIDGRTNDSDSSSAADSIMAEIGT